MSEPQSREIWAEDFTTNKAEIEAEAEVKQVLGVEEAKPSNPARELYLKIECKIEMWYNSTFINIGLNAETFNHIYKSKEALKRSIDQTLKGE